jgi:hypothetical protein
VYEWNGAAKVGIFLQLCNSCILKSFCYFCCRY